MTEERFSLKDHLFNTEKVAYLSGLLGEAVDGFDAESFQAAVLSRMPPLELKQRIALIAEVLADHLDADFDVAAAQIRSALPPPLDPTLTDDDFGDFIFAPFGKYVEDHGLGHYDTSMALLRDLTMRFSMEGSVRPFINDRPDETLRVFVEWARDDHYHVRRLVSESTRPLLPWAPRIDLEVEAPIPLLDILHADPTRYVTRSVANHLNDISKTRPDLVIAALTRWRGLGAQATDELDWVIAHALRTLVKGGDAEALGLLGYSSDPDVKVGAIDLTTPVVNADEALEFSIPITAKGDCKLMIDYTIEFVKKNGSRKPKVFKLKKLAMVAGEETRLSKRHVLKGNATTYTLHGGTHGLTVIVNGTPVAEASFSVAL